VFRLLDRDRDLTGHDPGAPDAELEPPTPAAPELAGSASS
jgi:hypothetical protein